jgi:poly(A) polymerase
MKAPKQTLRSIKDVYSRLKWDGSIDSATIYIGYQDRIRGLVEMPYADFRPGGRVPWDRIQYFRMADVRIWDRTSRIDLVFGSGDTPAHAKLIGDGNGIQDEAQFGLGWPRIQASRWQAAESRWAADQADNGFASGKWKVFTLNILSNHLIPSRPKDDARYLALLDFLRVQDADLIALQEVDQQFMKLLQAQPWVQAQYFVADNAGIGLERSHFEALLTRMAPHTVVVPLIDMQSRSIAAQFVAKGHRLTIVAMHLMSDLREGAGARREVFLQELIALLPVDEAVLLLGDFNFGDEYLSPVLADFGDAWLQLHPGEPGITYDGEQNLLALAMNPKSRVRRIDRIFLRNVDRFPFVEELEIVPAKSTGNQTLSDHHALAATLSFTGSFGAMRSAPKSNHAALCIIPPAAIWTEIQALRRQYDTSFTRWMPHINMIYGFIPEAYFPDAAAALQATLIDFEAFEICLEGFDTFEHAGSTTIYLKPDAAAIEQLRKLQAAANAIFPQCNDVERHGLFHPHLTVAKIPHARKKDARRFLQEWNALWEPMTFTVNALSLIARSDVRAFEVMNEVKLRSDLALEKSPSSITNALGAMGILPGKFAKEERHLALATVQKGIDKMNEELVLIPVGSTALGTAMPGSDLDFVCLGRMSADDFLFRAPKRMQDLQFARVASTALVPALKLYFADFSADLSYVQLADAFPLKSPSAWSAELRAGLSPAQSRAMRAATDADLIRRLIEDQETSYRIATIALKAWAQAQHVYGNAYGYPGGFAWSLLLAQVGPHATPEAWLKACFEDFGQRNWSSIVPGEGRVPMLLLSGETPPFNVTRNVTANTLRILQNAAEEALLRIWAIEEGEASWTEFFAQTEVPAIAHIVLRWQATTLRELEICGGWLQSQIIGIVQCVEAISGLESRPDSGFLEDEKLTQEYRIALLSYPDAHQAEAIHDLLSELEEDFICAPERPSGASIRTALEFV